MYPSYKRIQEEKKFCYPEESCILVTESKVEVTLQALLDHTVQRILMIDPKIFEGLSQEMLQSCTLISKWGFDGSGSQSRYQQVQESHDIDSALLMTCIVPQLYYEDGKDKTILWQNPWPSSTHYCRPCKLEFCKETRDEIKKEGLHISNQISKLHLFLQ